MRNYMALIWLALFTCFASAQDYEYGKPEDLRGLTKLYITTGSDIKNRDRIIKEIEQAKLGIVIVDTYAEGQMFMRFRGQTQEVVRGSTTRPADETVPFAITTVQRGNIVHGAGDVVIAGKEGRLRYVLHYEGEKSWGKMPASKFAKSFIKAYKKANK